MGSPAKCGPFTARELKTETSAAFPLFEDKEWALLLHFLAIVFLVVIFFEAALNRI